MENAEYLRLWCWNRIRVHTSYIVSPNEMSLELTKHFVVDVQWIK